MLRFLLCAFLALTVAPTAQAVEITNFRDALAELSGRGAETVACVEVLKQKQANTPDTLSRTQLRYAAAKGNMDAVINVMVDLTRGRDDDIPLSQRTEARLKSALTTAKALCDEANQFLTAADEEKSKGIWVLVARGVRYIAEAIGLSAAIIAIAQATDHSTLSDAEVNARISSLEAQRWPPFDQIPLPQ
jgi:hypothetical protein